MSPSILLSYASEISKIEIRGGCFFIERILCYWFALS
jgi:hypothetical protein